MGTAERREREKKKRSNDILDAAEKIFFAKGISNATMDDVAEQAELSKGTLYLYFKSKEDLYLGINLRALKIIQEMFKNTLTEKMTGIEKTVAIGRAYYKFYQTYPDYFNALIHFEALGIDVSDGDSLALQCMKTGSRALEILSDSIGEGIQDGSIRPDLDPVKTAYLLWAQTNGVIQIIINKRKFIEAFENFNPEELITEFFKLSNYALRPNA
ncbi:MAG: TetR/AcrR family transcriptional regulator [candidate division Zixibacteria bacterium]|nr:TetR/AcrR family transcriptional regulator [candidate division Zixibacteria bacterium]